MNKAINLVSLPVSFLREGKKFVAYTPALDLSTSGKTFTEVKKNFAEMVKVFFDEIITTGTLEEVLLNLGWVKKNKELVPPVLISQELKSFKMPVYK